MLSKSHVKNISCIIFDNRLERADTSQVAIDPLSAFLWTGIDVFSYCDSQRVCYMPSKILLTHLFTSSLCHQVHKADSNWVHPFLISAILSRSCVYIFYECASFAMTRWYVSFRRRLFLFTDRTTPALVFFCSCWRLSNNVAQIYLSSFQHCWLDLALLRTS